ncbi:MAG: hypothetical protein ACPG52_02315 [Cognaticolwellia sp.]
MQVTHSLNSLNSSNVAANTTAAVSKSSSVPAQGPGIRALARENFADESTQAQKTQAQTHAQQRFDVDEHAIALIEQEHVEREPFNQGNNQQSTGNSNSYNSSYDAPSNQHQSAVAAYQSVDSIAQRDNIQQIFGVDLFA